MKKTYADDTLELLTKREYFAVQIMAALVQRKNTTIDMDVEAAVIGANRLIEALSKSKEAGPQAARFEGESK